MLLFANFPLQFLDAGFVECCRVVFAQNYLGFLAK
jgi:hypothetical protein